MLTATWAAKRFLLVDGRPEAQTGANRSNERGVMVPALLPEGHCPETVV